jgi:hypothetical protein
MKYYPTLKCKQDSYHAHTTGCMHWNIENTKESQSLTVNGSVFYIGGEVEVCRCAQVSMLMEYQSRTSLIKPLRKKCC